MGCRCGCGGVRGIARCMGGEGLEWCVLGGRGRGQAVREGVSWPEVGLRRHFLRNGACGEPSGKHGDLKVG